MIAVIFEATPFEDKWNNYLELAEILKPQLSFVPGFISVERFQSMSDQKKVLSLSFWEDEKSVVQWRNLELHRQAQKAGRDNVFKDYRIRVALVQRDYSMERRTEAPSDSKAVHDKLI
ncbi:antibiotic biosynthesis monooxygenase [Pedobacter sp. HMF7647]|uniref:Antibiotic biosynthesis monooxygenase n=1 Tax=Hufsiella arboris TaxID=2695275 RepID=A0A7K1Y817_9SPHI|nr:antibiotic biosynthesis monooxygenase [Hufsiella arboris]MXV50734.1 antibiotic biosynthesis monooxygenase [Hufsiella arboris]